MGSLATPHRAVIEWLSKAERSDNDISIAERLSASPSNSIVRSYRREGQLGEYERRKRSQLREDRYEKRAQKEKAKIWKDSRPRERRSAVRAHRRDKPTLPHNSRTSRDLPERLTLDTSKAGLFNHGRVSVQRLQPRGVEPAMIRSFDESLEPKDPVRVSTRNYVTGNRIKHFDPDDEISRFFSENKATARQRKSPSIHRPGIPDQRQDLLHPTASEQIPPQVDKESSNLFLEDDLPPAMLPDQHMTQHQQVSSDVRVPGCQQPEAQLNTSRVNEILGKYGHASSQGSGSAHIPKRYLDSRIGYHRELSPPAFTWFDRQPEQHPKTHPRSWAVEHHRIPISDEQVEMLCQRYGVSYGQAQLS